MVQISDAFLNPREEHNKVTKTRVLLRTQITGPRASGEQ
jgi:hypothetical protein